MKLSIKEAAKETIRLLSVEQKAPTPENYTAIFNKVMGLDPTNSNIYKDLSLILIDNYNKILFEDENIKKNIIELKNLSVNADENIDKIQTILSSLVEKQDIMKNDLLNSQTKLQTMLAQFMDNLASFSAETDDYQNVIENSAKQIAGASKIEDITKTLDLVLQETKNIEEKSKNKRAEIQTIKHEAQAAQTEIERLRKELEKSSELVRIDPLTGVLNRKGMTDALEKAVQILNRTKKSFCIALLDIDNFKKLNDSLGHHAGDQALIHLSNIVKTSIRPQDTLARYGGEEFVVILADTEVSAGINVMERVQRELSRNSLQYEEHKINLTFSCGVSQVNEGNNYQEALIKADQAMYSAKQNGKNMVKGATQ